MKLNEIVYLKWLDHCSHYGWRDEFAKYEPMEVETIGFVIAETDKTITIAGSLSSVESVADPTVIIKSCILESETVEWV